MSLDIPHGALVVIGSGIGAYIVRAFTMCACKACKMEMPSK